MLTDNGVELVLHQIAKDKASDLKAFSYRNEKYEHQKALDKTLGGDSKAATTITPREGVKIGRRSRGKVQGRLTLVPALHRLTLRTDDRDDGARNGVAIEVIDTGSGMTPKVMRRIFDSFFSTR